MVCAKHPMARLAAEGAVPLDAYVAHPHILLAPGSPGANPVDGALGALGLSRRVAFTTADGVTTACVPEQAVRVSEGSVVSMGDHWLTVRRD